MRVQSFWTSQRLPKCSNNTARFDIKRRVSGIVVGQFRFTLQFDKNPLMPFSGWVALVHFVSSDVIVWSPSAPQIGMLHMFQTCRCFVSCVFEFVVVRFIDCVSFSRRVSRVCLEKFSSFVVDVFFSWFGYMKM